MVQSDEAQQGCDDADDAGDDPPAGPHVEGHHGTHRAQPEHGAQLGLGALGGGLGVAFGDDRLGDGDLDRRGARGLVPRRGGFLCSFLLRVRVGGTVAGLLGGLLWGLFGGLFGRQRARSRHTPSVGGGFIEGAPTYCVL